MFKSLADCSPDGVATLACVGIIINNIVVVFLIAAAIATILMIIIAGIRFSLSGGDPKRVASAKASITYAIIGIVIVSMSFVILGLVSNITGNKDIINGPEIVVPQKPINP